MESVRILSSFFKNNSGSGLWVYKRKRLSAQVVLNRGMNKGISKKKEKKERGVITCQSRMRVSTLKRV